MSRYNEDIDYHVKDIDITGEELEEIIREADSILTGQNPNPEQKTGALLKKAQALQKLDKFEESREYVEQILELKPEMPQALVRLGNVYDEKKECDKALEYMTKSININKEYPYAYRMRGYTYYTIGEYDKAVADYNRAIELKSDYALAYNNRGTVYYDIGKHEKAIADYNKAIKLEPKYANAYHNRSVVFCKTGEYTRAFQDELKCLEHIQNRQDHDIIAKIQWVIGSIIKNSESLDFIWNSTKEELKSVPNFFLRIIGSFKEEGFTGKKYKNLVNAVIKLWKGCYDADRSESGKAVILYQYTTMPVLRAMFESQCLRLSPASYLNDPNEGKTVFTYLKEKAEALKEYPEKIQKVEALRKYLEKIQEKEAERNDIVFIRSFTDKEDSLAMWNSSYADNGRGVSIGIPASLVNKGQGTPAPTGLTINDVGSPGPGIGKQEDQPIPLELLGLFKIRYDKNCVEEIAKCLEVFDENDLGNGKLTELTARLFVPVAPLVKGEDYQHESEYRLVYIASWEDVALKKYIRQTPEDGVYIETEKVLFERFDKFKDDYPDKEYVEVYIGPKVDKIIRLKCWDRFRYRYPDMKKVKQSKIEWR
jgi:tetratricopeptide (TPR) repeat protein